MLYVFIFLNKKFESEPHLRPLFLKSAKPYNSLNQHNMPNASDG